MEEATAGLLQLRPMDVVRLRSLQIEAARRADLYRQCFDKELAGSACGEILRRSSGNIEGLCVHMHSISLRDTSSFPIAVESDRQPVLVLGD